MTNEASESDIYDIENVGFGNGVDASQFGGELQQELFKIELPGGNNSNENAIAINRLEAGTMDALNKTEKRIRTVAFEKGSIPPIKGSGGLATQGVASYTLTSPQSQVPFNSPLSQGEGVRKFGEFAVSSPKEEKINHRGYKYVSRVKPGSANAKIDEDELRVTVSDNNVFIHSASGYIVLAESDAKEIIPLLPPIGKKSKDTALTEKITKVMSTAQNNSGNNTLGNYP
jgi:hypothetical protein